MLGADFRDTIINYYAYKFALRSEELVSRKVVDVLEREFQKTKYREVILRLDSKDLEERITLNPPPEVKPLLDRVIIPILELKGVEAATLKRAANIEMEKTVMEKILKIISQELIGILFIGKKKPKEYLEYVKENLANFRGLLVCSRGAYADIYEKYIHEKLVSLLSFNVVEKRFEGELEITESKGVFHRYVLLVDKELLKPLSSLNDP